MSGARADVVVHARAGACLADVRTSLLDRVLPTGAAGRLGVAGAAVPPATLLGATPLVQGALLQVDGPDRPSPAALQLRVVSGYDAGRVHQLHPGAVEVGREGDARLLPDPSVSRRHCRLDVAHDGVTVHDLGSANGTWVDGERVESAQLAPGALLRLGDARLLLARAPVDGPPPRPTGDGHLAVDRPPRLQPARDVVQVVVPAPPPARERSPLPVLAVLVPLALGIVMWQVTGSTTFLLLTALSPVVLVGAAVTERRAGRRRVRREHALHAARRRVAEQVLATAVRDDELARRAQWPDLAEVVLTAVGPGPRLWERRGDALDLRLGLGDQPARVEAEGDLAGLRTTARDVPLVVPMRGTGVLGIAGDGARALGRAVLVQAATLHGPRDLQLVVLAAGRAAPGWQWTRWLPHLVPDGGQDCRALLGLNARQVRARVGELTALLDARRSETPRPAEGHDRSVLVLLDGARSLRGVPGLARLLADGPAHGIHAVCVEDGPELLPPECRATAVVAGQDLCLRRDGHDERRGRADLLAPDLAETAARALAPLREPRLDRDGAEALPPQVRWTEEVDLPLEGGVQDADRVLQRWGATGRTTTVLLGRGADGPLSVDLVRDGPHALVAGTTGSGKSELLQTLIASLAVGNRPDELALVLVDYKGGAAFGPCEHLPHVVGMVTDLDGGLVERALVSLRAELSRREAVLRAAGCKDVEAHRRTAPVEGVLPRLVLVVDEFASLAEELPAFVTGLVDVAMRGRSLGVHLVLATQRPEGVVSAEIRANTNLRLCLAVTRDAESRDVLDSPVAAAISRATPGRAWVRTGHTDLAPFQAARVGGRRPPPADGDSTPTVELCPAAELGDPRPLQTRTGAGEQTDLALLVTACTGAARRLGLRPTRSPWLPALPAVVVHQDLPDEPDPSAGTPGRVPPLAYGLLDVPATQSRRPLVLDLDHASHLLVLGAARSGRTTVLRGLAGALARTASPDDVHLYAVDGGGGLGGLTGLPHTGAVVALDQHDRLDRLLQHLARETRRRQELLTAGGLGCLTEQRAAAAPDDRLPHLLLLLDRWEAFTAAFGDLDLGRLVELVHQLLREGPAVGLHVVLTADRSGLVGRTCALVQERLVLRMADPADYVVAGLPARLVPGALGAGRGWSLTPLPLSAQVALLDPDPAGPAQAVALARLVGAVPPPVRPPRRVDVLPASVCLAALRTPDTPQPGAVLLGVGGDELRPVAVPRTSLLVAGPPGSGRSTTLRTIAAGVTGLPVVAVTPRPSPLRDLPGCLTTQDPDALQALLGDGRVALLLDDVELLVDGALGPLLDDVVQHARDRGTFVVAAGTTTRLLTGYRGAVVELRRARSGLLLCPESAADGELLDVRLSRATSPDLRPGRGLLVQAGQVMPLQVARP